MMYGLKGVMTCTNSFINNWMGLSWMLRKPKIPMCFIHSTSFSVIQRYNLYISKKIIFLLSKRLITIFFLIFSFHYDFNARWYPPSSKSKFSFLFILFAISLLMFPPLMVKQNQCKFWQNNNVQKIEMRLDE